MVSEATTGFPDFFARYREFEEKRRNQIEALDKKHAHEAARGFESGFHRIKHGLEPIEFLIHENKRLNASDFNVFHLLGVQKKELKHSAVLADLLNPAGSHSQGDLFLRRFIEYCQNNEKLKEKFQPLNRDIYRYKWFVTTEEPIPAGTPNSDKVSEDDDLVNRQGRLDIAIRCPQGKFLLVIENKIGWGEQPRQLERYLRWIELLLPLYSIAILIYLTPDGRESSTSGSRSYLRFSYQEDIALWLNSTLPDIRSHRLRETLRQYIELVCELAEE